MRDIDYWMNGVSRIFNRRRSLKRDALLNMRYGKLKEAYRKLMEEEGSNGNMNLFRFHDAALSLETSHYEDDDLRGASTYLEQFLSSLALQTNEMAGIRDFWKKINPKKVRIGETDADMLLQLCRMWSRMESVTDIPEYGGGATVVRDGDVYWIRPLFAYTTLYHVKVHTFCVPFVQSKSKLSWHTHPEWSISHGPSPVDIEDSELSGIPHLVVHSYDAKIEDLGPFERGVYYSIVDRSKREVSYKNEIFLTIEGKSVKLL